MRTASDALTVAITGRPTRVTTRTSTPSPSAAIAATVSQTESVRAAVAQASLRTPDDRSEQPDLGHEPREHVRQQRLRAVGERHLRMVVYLDQEPISLLGNGNRREARAAVLVEVGE